MPTILLITQSPTKPPIKPPTNGIGINAWPIAKPAVAPASLTVDFPVSNTPPTSPSSLNAENIFGNSIAAVKSTPSNGILLPSWPTTALLFAPIPFAACQLFLISGPRLVNEVFILLKNGVLTVALSAFTKASPICLCKFL